MSRLWLSLLGFIIAATASGIAMAQTTSISNEKEKDLISWVISKGGIINDKLEIRHIEEGNNGVFAKEDIQQDELLLEIPREILLGGKDDECKTVKTLVEAWKLGDKSEYFPYTEYLLSRDPDLVPTGWSDQGKSVLLDLLGRMDDDNTNDLPPAESVNRIDPLFYDECDASRDPSGIRAVLFLLQRGWDDLMIPVYDLLNHRNGEYLNTMTRNSVHDLSTPIRVYASKDIRAGDEIYSTYNWCEDCGARNYGYGTAEILRDYGFVEMFPQRWFFYYDVAFQLNENKESGELNLEWLGGEETNDDGIRHISSQLRRMDMFDLESDEAKAVPEAELNMIKQYRDALIVAFKAALNYLCQEDPNDPGDELCVLTRQYLSCRADSEGDAASCPLLTSYDALDWKKDGLKYATYTCDAKENLSLKEFETIETPLSHYQDIEFAKDSQDNVCLLIGDTFQICDSYRPQYHEMAVHYAARYLKDIRRVLFVGGGDSMLAHEFLKYQSMELVVGLELDQTITRYSFKHMGTQPHWDNEKVQWWYGDAAKSMLLLPKDYFGSFDLVVVDLSETVMSMSVTKELDILHALTLLLKPEGIFVKNEFYMDEMSSMFRYALQIHYTRVPVVCSQSMVLGSNSIDFLNDDVREHKLDNNLYIKPLESIKEHYEFFHDYRHNRTADVLCETGDEPMIETEKHQSKSPGILMVVEAENAGGKLKYAKSVLNAIEKALNDEGLHPVSSFQSKGVDNPSVAVILEEGYVVARTWPDKKYVAFDIHFWSSFDKQNVAKKALVKAVKGNGERSTSAYRIVAGGMFGTSTWEEDQNKRGPHPTLPCVVDPEPPRGKTMDKSHGDTIMEAAVDEMVQLFEDGGIVAAVICGEYGTECKAVDVLKKAIGVDQVVPIWLCTDLGNETDFDLGAAQKLTSCEAKMTMALLEQVAEDSLINLLVVDTVSPYNAGRIAYNIFKTHDIRLLQDDFVVLSVVFEKHDEWRHNMLERFRTKIIVQDPLFRAEILFNNSESTIEFGVTTSKHSNVDNNFVRRLVNLAATVENKTDLESDVRFLKGGQPGYDPDWKWEHFFLPQDFDQGGALEQWLSQQPLAYQVLFQFEKADAKLELSVDKIERAFEYALVRTASTSSARASHGMENAKLHVSTGMGEGCVILAFWEGGNVVLLWDGRDHIDLNWFTFDEFSDMEEDLRSNFMSHFPQGSMKLVVVDEQPRGTGRTVNFRGDLEPFEANNREGRTYPVWANKWAAQNSGDSISRSNTTMGPQTATCDSSNPRRDVY